ncbi:hypothetical protein [Nocardia sp. CDC160]|uniref:hypothetical protein n=1 Tax=Nocardia sp. CDC160 TaxID=3112166 RepID=UPI002DBA59B6|nr:hypothetical protein [Nocardia sp. CDC160]MEC3920320.1 hypothetical protein [Nocardia sp. CDC160]
MLDPISRCVLGWSIARQLLVESFGGALEHGPLVATPGPKVRLDNEFQVQTFGQVGIGGRDRVA